MSAQLRLKRMDADAPAHGAGDIDVQKEAIFDKRFNAYSMRVLPGEFYTTDKADEMVVTVLGSCVAACIRDPRTGYGGLNHFMLPESESGEWDGVSAAMRYGNFAMEALINAVLKSGCQRKDLEIKLFGGANFTSGPSMIGQKNADFAMRYLQNEGLRVIAHDLGGGYGRRIHYFPTTGAVKRFLLKGGGDKVIVEREQRYVTTLKQAPVEGDIDLFD
jgi:chemotaxis protein CheD